VLAALIVIHIIRALVWLDFRSMLIGRRDVGDGWAAVRAAIGASDDPAPLPGKCPLLQKLYHAAIAITVLALLVTGAMMMVRIDTPFWIRNPYWLAPATWGIVYVVHGLAAMMVLSLVMVHIYFGLRPEKLWITRSMIAGWITETEYVSHHDPARWKLHKGGRE
jgi:formate dehydrogenase subunit gamma